MIKENENNEQPNILHNYANQYLNNDEHENLDADVMRFRDEVQNDMRSMLYDYIDSNRGVQMDDFVNNIINHENTVFGREVMSKETDAEWVTQMITNICTDDGISDSWFNK